MRNLSILRDSICCFNWEQTDDSASCLARLCTDSDTGNVYAADVTHGSVSCLASTSQVRCDMCAIISREHNTIPQFKRNTSASLRRSVSISSASRVCRSFGHKVCRSPLVMAWGLAVRLPVLHFYQSWRLCASLQLLASYCLSRLLKRCKRQVVPAVCMIKYSKTQ